VEQKQGCVPLDQIGPVARRSLDATSVIEPQDKTVETLEAYLSVWKLCQSVSRLSNARINRLPAFAILAAGSLALTASAVEAADLGLSVELNKLETQDKGCRAYMVVDNTGTSGYQSLKLDLVLFQSDGVIGRRFAVDLAPLKATKKTVKLFDLDGTACDKVGSLLINDVVECKNDAGPVNDCLAGITVKSLTNVQLSK
jgi:hypothetical protein